MLAIISPEFLAQCIALYKEKGRAIPAPSSSELSDFAVSDSVVDELASPQSITASFRAPISDLEAKHYYHGLPSKPVLVARTGTDAWKPPTGPEVYFRCKELRVVGNHHLKAVWRDNLAFQIRDILDSKGVKWTSMDVACIGFVGESAAPTLIWIGVKPDTLSGEDGLAVAKECKQLLVAAEILDVEVEIRESVVIPYGLT
ncbi:hypothetical protein BC834DRAFT_1017862 [Gloeopeniophorella convolvens]|nr:hypothetical protein BC834DRAFT_1017862 [Gloeopeniophorella convolvens]